jgi:predicted patatin/cPLA2 family phospholipase
VVYGSSAGSLVGAYFLSEQMPYFGMEVYYDVLTTAGKQFIDLQSLLRSLGLGLFDLRFSSIKKLFTDRYVWLLVWCFLLSRPLLSTGMVVIAR